MEKIQFLEVTPQQLKKEISQDLKTYLDEFLKNFTPQQPKEYLTRKGVAELLSVDLSTVHNWCKSGKLKPLGIGKRVYFLRSEVENSLLTLND